VSQEGVICEDAIYLPIKQYTHLVRIVNCVDVYLTTFFMGTPDQARIGVNDSRVE
jgi:hypothetical protein